MDRIGHRPRRRTTLPLALAARVCMGALAARATTLAAVDPVVGSAKAPAKAPRADAAPRAPAPDPKPTAHDTATLAAAVEANRIAKEALTAQIYAARSQADLGLGALALSGIAGVAAVAAALYARKAWRENRRSADVAERMLSGYERPFLILEIVKSGVTLGERSITFDVTTYRFRNLGRVPALITRRHFELEDGVEMPEPIDPHKEAGKPVVHGVAVAADGMSQEHETGRALPIHSALKRGRKRERRKEEEAPSVFFHGFVEYRDLSGRSWITGFCFAQSDNEFGFQPLSLTERGAPDPYNYDRQIT